MFSAGTLTMLGYVELYVNVEKGNLLKVGWKAGRKQVVKPYVCITTITKFVSMQLAVQRSVLSRSGSN
jgi:hypothetical protein